jgi:uncharacterized cupredoxin-like copper-binding protein
MNRWRSGRQLYLILALAASSLLLAAGCGSDDEPTAAPTHTPTVPAAATVAVELGEWFVTSDPISVSAGEVTFTAENVGAIEHELIVLKTDLAPESLVVDAGLVDETLSGTFLGEIEPDELGPGQSASMTLDLAPGSYVLFCNIPAHYQTGMRTTLQVE